MAETSKIPGELESVAIGGKVADVRNIKDGAHGNKSQAEINAEHEAALEDRYTKEETYSKEQVNNLITTPGVQYVSVTATELTTSVTDVLPATGAADTIYRVGSWDGTQYDATVYSEYAWNGTLYVLLGVKSAIGEVYDISAATAVGGVLTKYADLAAALGTNGENVPEGVRKGGMSIKFVQSSDNKYVQFRYMLEYANTTAGNNAFVNPDNWHFCGKDTLIENPEYIRAITDDAEHLLCWIRKSDGGVDWAVGVPTPVKEYIETEITKILNGSQTTDIDGLNKIIAFLDDFSTSDTLKELLADKADKEELDTKVDKAEGKGLSTNDFTDNDKAVVDKISFVENEEYIGAKTDRDGKFLEGFNKKGEKIWAKMPPQIKDYVENYVNKYVKEHAEIHNIPKGSLMNEVSQYNTEGGIIRDFVIIKDMREWEHVPLILTIDAKYESNDASVYPYVRTIIYKNGNIAPMHYSGYYKIGDTTEYKQIQLRVPPYTDNDGWYLLNIQFYVPSGVYLHIRNCNISSFSIARRFTDAIMYQAHVAFGAPENTLRGFQSIGQMGYNYMITIPKFTSDGVGVCFHDDASISGDLEWVNGDPITGADDKPIDQYTYTELIQNFNVKSRGRYYLSGYKVATLDDYFRCCSEYGLNPVLSIHPNRMFKGETGRTNWNRIKAFLEKYNIVNRLFVKSSDADVQSLVTEIFGDSIGGRILLFSISETPTANPLATAKSCGLVDAQATTAKDSPYNLWVEWFARVVTDERIATAISQGFKVSVAGGTFEEETQEVRKDFINKGVCGFTTNNFTNVGLYW